MEFFLVITVIGAICFIFGVGTDFLLYAGGGIVGLIIISMFLIFSRFMAALVSSKKKNAVFSKIDKPSDGKFKSAFYAIGEKEYPCFFPSEFKIMYKKGKQCNVLLNEKMGKVFDRFSMITCIAGFIFSLTVVGAVIWFLAFLGR